MTSLLCGAEKKDLPARWKAWLNEDISYIITAKEREVFLVLGSDKEREAFVDGFWLQRDPTPGTPANEFRNEHFRRLKYADEFYGRSSMKKGRETDRGRIYILLGEPISSERFEEGTENLTPSELWQYHGDVSLGLPAFFYVLFFRRDPNSDYMLYSPSFDGPNKLFRGFSQSSYDRQSAYKTLKTVSGELAEASLNLIPGLADNASTAPSLSSDFLISSIQSLPERKVKSDWAVAFANHREIITVDHTVNYLPAEATLFVHQTDGISVLHTVIEPRRLTMSQNKNIFYAPLKLHVKVSARNGALVHQEEKDIPVEIAQENFDSIAKRIAAVGDILPLIEGTFDVSYLLMNTESKEFSSFAETVLSPGKGVPLLSPLLILYDVKPVSKETEMAPFVFDHNKLFPSSSRTLAKGDPLRVYFEIYNPDDASATGTLRFSIDGETANVLRTEEAVSSRRYFLKTFSEADLRPGHYTLSVSVVDTSGNETTKTKGRFSISSLSEVPKPWRFDKLYPSADHPYYAVIRSYEYIGIGDPAKAAASMEPLYDEKNPNITVTLLLARAYFEMTDDIRVVSILESVRKQENAEANLLLGKSLYRLGRFADALPALEAALRSIGQTVEVLNLIGTSHLKIGQNDRGLPYLVRSLEANPNQPDIRNAIEAASKRR